MPISFHSLVSEVLNLGIMSSSSSGNTRVSKPARNVEQGMEKGKASSGSDQSSRFVPEDNSYASEDDPLYKLRAQLTSVPIEPARRKSVASGSQVKKKDGGKRQRSSSSESEYNPAPKKKKKPTKKMNAKIKKQSGNDSSDQEERLEEDDDADEPDPQVLSGCSIFDAF